MQVKIIRTEKDYSEALSRIEEIFDAKPNTPEGDELELLALLVENYEESAHPIDPPDPLDAIRFRMEQQGLAESDLVPYLGGPEKVSEVLAGKCELSVAMIRNLVSGLKIPAEVLLQSSGRKDAA